MVIVMLAIRFGKSQSTPYLFRTEAHYSFGINRSMNGMNRRTDGIATAYCCSPYHESHGHVRQAGFIILFRGIHLTPMSFHAHAEYLPPKTWQQFEELCADTFATHWNDPALVRHGRAGQRQLSLIHI